MRITALAILVSLLPLDALPADTGDGGTGEQLTFTDARIYALGGGGYALPDNVYSLGRNPALIADTPVIEFAFGDTLLPGTAANIRTAGFLYSGGKIGAAGFYAASLYLPGVSLYDDGGNPTGTLNYHNTEIGGAYAYPITEWLSIGAGGQYNFRNMGDDKPAWFAADFGISLQPLAFDYILEDSVGRVMIGASLSDLAVNKAKFEHEEYRPDTGADLGVAWSHRLGKSQRIIATADISNHTEEPFTFGAEYSIGYTVAVRGGLSGNDPTFGAGYSSDLFDLDYAYVLRDMGAVHSVSVSLYIGRDRKARDMKRLTIEKWLDEGRSYYSIGSYDQALRRFDNVLEWTADHEEAQYYKARCTYERYLAEGKENILRGDWEKARRSFNAALVIYPDDFIAREYVTRTNELEEQEEIKHRQDEKAAKVIAEAAVEVNKGKLLGGANGKNTIRTAIKTLENLDKEIPGREDVAQALAAARRALGSIVEPEVEVTPEIKVIPESARVRYEMGNSRLNDGRIDDAITILSPLVSEYPYYYEARGRLIEAYIYKGLDQYSKGYLSSAIITWKKVLEVDPTNTKAKRYIEQAEAEMDKIRGPR